MQYNQTLKAQSVRVGNWQEELKLKEDTGVRYYPDPHVKANSLLTRSRCIDHTDRIDPKNYTSVTKSTIVDPKTQATFIAPKVGPRQAKLESTLRKQVEDEVMTKTSRDFIESRKLTYATLTKDSFIKSGFKPTLRENDITVREPTRTTNYSTDIPITYYSYAIKDPDQKVSFPTTFVGSIDPFKKNSFFSADIEHDVIARRTETYERPKPLPTVQEFKILVSLKNKWLKKAKEIILQSSELYEPGSSIRYILQLLINPDLDYLGINDLEYELDKGLNGFSFNRDEVNSLISAFDMKNSNKVSIGDICLFLRRTPSPRRLELIGLHFASIDPNNIGIVNTDTLAGRVSATGCSKTHLSWLFVQYINEHLGKEFTAEDYYEYYTEISSEVEDDDEFEDIIKNTWAFI